MNHFGLLFADNFDNNIFESLQATKATTQPPQTTTIPHSSNISSNTTLQNNISTDITFLCPLMVRHPSEETKRLIARLKQNYANNKNDNSATVLSYMMVTTYGASSSSSSSNGNSNSSSSSSSSGNSSTFISKLFALLSSSFLPSALQL